MHVGKVVCDLHPRVRVICLVRDITHVSKCTNTASNEKLGKVKEMSPHHLPRS